MKQKSIFIIIIIFLSFSVEHSFSQQVQLIKCGSLLNVSDGNIRQDTEILIKGNTITAIGKNLSRPVNCSVIDLSNMFVMPGFIDGHTHICICEDYYDRNPIIYESIPYRTVKACRAVRRNLEAGFTSLRDVGSEGAALADIAVKDGINNGVIPGPRLQVSSLALTILGGYEDIRGFAPELILPAPGVIVTSRDEMIEEVRRQVKYGADLLKIYATGTIADITPEKAEPLSQLSVEEVRVIVKESERWGKFVSAHAYGGDGARNSILGGARSIEHGILLDEKLLDLMKEHGTFWCPTLYVYVNSAKRNPDSERYKLILKHHKRAFKMGVEKGVKIAFGTDTGPLPHGENAKEFEIMVEYGMTPLQAIQSATIVAAELMGWEKLVGSIDKGKYADIIAFGSNPVHDISVLQKVKFVMKDGVVIKHERN